jgi:glutaredoxin
MITVYSKNNCRHCTQTAELLTSKDIDFTMVKIDEDAAAMEFVLSRNHKTVPQLYIGTQLLIEGGLSGLRRLSDAELNTRITNYATNI